MPSKTYMITSNDEVIEVNGQAVPGNIKGLQHIRGKAEPGDREKYTMKADPSLVKEFVKGKEAENLGRTPIMVYDYSEPRWAKKIDSWTANAICFGLGAGLMGCLYYWGILNFFAK